MRFYTWSARASRLLRATVNTKTEADGHVLKSGVQAPRVCDKGKFVQLMTYLIGNQPKPLQNHLRVDRELPYEITYNLSRWKMMTVFALFEIVKWLLVVVVGGLYPSKGGHPKAASPDNNNINIVLQIY